MGRGAEAGELKVGSLLNILYDKTTEYLIKAANLKRYIYEEVSSDTNQ